MDAETKKLIKESKKARRQTRKAIRNYEAALQEGRDLFARIKAEDEAARSIR